MEFLLKVKSLLSNSYTYYIVGGLLIILAVVYLTYSYVDTLSKNKILTSELTAANSTITELNKSTDILNQRLKNSNESYLELSKQSNKRISEMNKRISELQKKDLEYEVITKGTGTNEFTTRINELFSNASSIENQ